jgi:hypothetical protein
MSFIFRAAGILGAGVLAAAAFGGLASADITGNTNYSSQTGTNTNTSAQTAAAISGNATAVDAGVATSGAATTTTSFTAAQSIYAALFNQSDETGGAVDISDNVNGSADLPVSQAAANLLANTQNNAAASGAADASDDGSATTGAAASSIANIQAQIQELINANQSASPAPVEEEEPAP